ncbi:hypothetical protein MKX07_003230 [Trichoderma sp. CBMAI-0711]|nr:hypothetical protein MKX07_003230 [Trichoderma sp. CBMAI-0711]
MQSTENARTLGASLDQEGQNATNDEKNTDDIKKAVELVKYDEMQEVKPTVSSLDVESAEKIDKQGRKKHSSEKKRQAKRPHKRSKSGDHHAESSKRAKTLEASVLNGEVENPKVSGPGSHAEAKGVEQARARIPTNCSIRHEYDQEQELKAGKKLAKSKRHTKFMRTTPEDHQLTALSWMVKREKEFPRPAAGGIIGDEMGLGKTVTSLSCIATNRLNKSERTKRAQATLVIVPSRKIALQWRDEARKHWTEEASQNVIVYSTANELGPKHYAKQWIVIATYTQVRNQYPSQEFMNALDRQYADDPRAHRREFRKEARELFLVDWFRVILDESHEITRWNGRKFYSYATFICCNFIGNRRDATNDYFDTIASYLMYRRTAGKNLNIPPTTHQELYVEVSAEEEVLCNAINAFYERRQKEHEEGKENKGMPLLEDEYGVDEVEDLMPEQGKTGERSKESSNFLMSQDYLDQSEFGSLFENLRSVAEEKTVIEQLEADPGWQQHLGNYRSGLDILKKREEVSLGGIFDMNSIMMQRSNLPTEQQNGVMKCSVDGCGQDLLLGQPVMTLEMVAAKARADKNYVEIGKDAIGTTVQPKNDSSVFFVASSFYREDAIPPPSSRLTATLAVAMTWLTEAPQDKIIIFTQFIPTLKMLGYLFQILGVKFVYYSGALPKQKQDHAMNAFQNDPKTMVMISTMKSGGQSHNLTVANRVIIVDLWWNKMAEKQAISRVARMGQTKRTFSVRIVTKHSMDDHVIEVQKAKEETVARMLQDDGHERTEVNDEALEKMFEPKSVEKEKSKKRKGVKASVTDMIFKEESPE